jgi:DNA primase
MVFNDNQKLAVQQSTDIVRLIGEHVALKARGKEYLGLCPFHDDKKPSMHVSPAKQIYKCFACGNGGDVFSFVMNFHKMTFPEALKMLAERAGIKIDPPKHQAGEKHEGPTQRERIADANVKAVAFFRSLYRHPEQGKIAREYVENRHISPDMVEAFGIGYSPDGWDGLMHHIQKNGWDIQAFELAGLVSARSGGNGHFDKLRHRIIFPIYDSIGRPIAFGGRQIRKEDDPKYLNSPETAMFIKSQTLYGLHLAKKPIIDSRTAVVVEGYVDVVACHQAGVSNVVATLGTALTPQHVAELRRFADRVVLVYDGDEAGQKAADRAIEVFLTGGLDVAIAVIPDEYDPADLFELPDGKERWQKVMDGATDALEFQFDRVKASLANSNTVTGKQRVMEDYLRRLAQAGLDQAGTIRRSMVVGRVADVLRVSPATVDELIKRLAPVRVTPSASQTTPQNIAPARTAPPAILPSAPAPPPADSYDDAPDFLAMGDAALPGGHVDQHDPSSQHGSDHDHHFEPAADDHPAPPAEPAIPELPSAPPIPPAKLRAYTTAQLHVLGCMLHQPALFHVTLSDGRTFDEAITPHEFLPGPERELYDVIYPLLCEGQALTTSSLLATLSSLNRQDLSNLATQVDAETEEATGLIAEKLQQLLLTSANYILGLLHEPESWKLRQSLITQTPGGPELLAKRWTQERKTQVSKLRIFRPGR